MPLTEPQHKRLALLEKTLEKALDEFPPVTGDTDQATAREVLRQQQAAFAGHLTDIRNRS